ncbi:hypothetical protein ACROYT_G033842 [Oculina patagonica]
MANFTDDGNHITTGELFCKTDFNEQHNKIFILALNIPLSITAFVGNILIIVALPKVSSLHPPSKLLFRFLASTDLCVGLISQPLYVYSALMPPSPPHSLHCYSRLLLRATGTIFCLLSLFTLTTISVDRLLALSLGLRYRQVVTLRRVRIFVVISWLSSIAIALMFFYSKRTTAFIFCTIALLCVLSSTICYTKIYFKLRHHHTAVQVHIHQGQPNGGGIPLNVARYRKTVSSALWVQITLVVCYLPYGIVRAIFVFAGLNITFHDIALATTLSLVFLNSSINPFLYCWKMREVRQAAKNTIRQFLCFSS